jgi:flavin reductase (DIM6/NTAB) family NADH-FMN oxidoreductase RutF
MFHYEPKDLSIPEVHKFLLGGVGPRPIALVSTISKNGILNLSPFSFYNAFGANPPIIAFSPSRRGRDGSLKDTYNNLHETRECVVQAVTYEMVEQISLASAEFSPEVNEFEKCGLTPIDSDLVKPKRVKESPFQMECILRDMFSYGNGGASANIAVCEVIKFHIAEDIFREGIIHPDLINLVARMSGEFYSRASGDSIFVIERPNQKKVIGYDKLPNFMKQSNVFSANNLAKFANVSSLPTNEDIAKFIREIETLKINNLEISEEAIKRYERNKEYKKMLKAIISLEHQNEITMRFLLEVCAKIALEKGDTDFAWKVALYSQTL